MTTRRAYPNPPSPKLLEKIGAANLTLADAIAEVVANSFDASIESERTIIEVSISQDQIVIVDNGLGMSEPVLVEAVRLGVDMSEVVKKKNNAKGMFGLGMKTACASMGRWWAVYTRPIDKNKEYRVDFDLADWENRVDSADAWTVFIEEIEPDFAGPLGERPHGTAVLVRKLRSRNPLVGAVITKLGESFKPHLEQGDEIIINGDKATPHVYKFIPGSKVPIDLTFGPASEYHIEGWVAIDQQTHNDGEYGFNIYRHNQLVQTWYKDWFRAHLMTSRIIGEVSMDFIDSTFFKQGLQESEVWRLAKAEMTEFLRPIVSASSNLSKKGNVRIPAKRNSIIRNMISSLGLETENDMPVSSNPKDENLQVNSNDEQGEDNGHTDNLVKLQVEAERVTLKDGTEISISRIETEMGEDGPPFDFIHDNENPVGLQTIINIEHPLYYNSKDHPQLRYLAIADSILRYLVDKCGTEIRYAVEIRNVWLFKALELNRKG